MNHFDNNFDRQNIMANRAEWQNLLDGCPSLDLEDTCSNNHGRPYRSRNQHSPHIHQQLASFINVLMNMSLVMVVVLSIMIASGSTQPIATSPTTPTTLSSSINNNDQQIVAAGSSGSPSSSLFLPSNVVTHHSLPVKRATRQYSFGLGKRQQQLQPSYRETAEILELPIGIMGNNGITTDLLQGALPIASQKRSDLIYVMAYPASPQTDYIFDPSTQLFMMTDSTSGSSNSISPSSSTLEEIITVPEMIDQQQMTAPAPATPQSIESSKRSRPQRFSFGLGKRSKEQVMFTGANSGQDIDEYQFADDGSYGSSISKRRVQPYSFGLGKKRTWFSSVNGQRQNKKIKKLNNFEDFIKRRYSFGLGKRSV